MHLYLIRHAQSFNNDLYTRTGTSAGRQADPLLTETGHKQAKLLAEFLAHKTLDQGDSIHHTAAGYHLRHNRCGFDLTHLYCSLMTRAIQTGIYVAAATGLPLVAWPEVHERGGLHLIDEETGEDRGVAGPGRSWFGVQYPQLILPGHLGEDGWWNRPLETIAEAGERARGVWAQLLERHGGSDDRVAIITHAGFFQSLMSALMIDRGEFSSPILGNARMGFGVSNVSISRFEISVDDITIRYINRVDYLPDELITG